MPDVETQHPDGPEPKVDVVVVGAGLVVARDLLAAGFLSSCLRPANGYMDGAVRSGERAAREVLTA